jgi:hypothetical protein
VSPANGTAAASREIQIPGHKRSMILADACLRCECASTILGDPGKHPVTHMEPFDVAANGNNFAREFVAQHKRKIWPQDCAKLALSELEIYRVQTRSAYFNENIAWPWHMCRDIHQPRAFRAAVMLKNVCAHHLLQLRGVSPIHLPN